MPFRGVSVVEVGNSLIGFIFLVGFSPLIPQINFLNPVGYLMDRGISG